MSLDHEQIQELIADESDIDVSELCEAAKFGLPHSLRGSVWKILLQMAKINPYDEINIHKLQTEWKEIVQQIEEGAVEEDTLKRIRMQTKRYLRSYSKSNLNKETNYAESIEIVVAAHLQWNFESKYQPGLVNLALPFVFCLSNDYEAFFCFESLLILLEERDGVIGVTETLALFMMLFRELYPELAIYFEEEDINQNDWAMSWLKWLLSKELPIDCVSRLWDTYFSSDVGIGLHIYVCLAIIDVWTDELIELEDVELTGFLQHLPPMNMDMIIRKAYNIRGKTIARDLI
eukprot:TRINITY_DN1258_c0_g1_i1.p1 TRINITY_DN1258_c0_g1~~TRINITY_DN1258_c0_g1_i1.p1  ORF type:complete len:290 (-),score=69.44 TRINITY_DN1258_c0_g1_i1:193-1062(-)